MSRPLLELVARGQLRRVRTLAQERRIVTAVVVAAWLAAPVAAWRLGAGAGEALSTALDDPSSARALVVGTSLAAAALGAAVAVAYPGRIALGAQVASSPLTRRASTVAVMAPVACGVLVFLAPTALALVASVVAPTGGSTAVAALVATLVVSVCAGAAGAESVLHLARRGSPVRSTVVLGCAIATSAIAVEAGARGLSGTFRPVLGIAVIVAGSACAEAWLRLAGARPEQPVRQRRARSRDPRPRVIELTTALAMLWRPADLRVAVAAAASFGMLGLAVGVATGAPIAVALLLGGGSCAAAVSLVPLSVRGRIDPGAWAWRAAARPRVAGVWAAASSLIVAISLVPAHALAAPAGESMLGAAAQVAALAALVWAAALTAGALVPRRRAGAGDDALALGAFTAVTVAGGGLASLGGRWLGAVGVPDGPAAGIVLAAAAFAAVTVLGATWGAG